MVRLGKRLVSHPAAARLRIHADRLARYEEVGKAHVVYLAVALMYVFRPEYRETVIVSEIYHVIVRMQTYRIDILLHCKTVTVHMADELLLPGIILPYSHRRGTPDVTVVRLYDISHCLVSQHLASGHVCHFASTRPVHVNTLLGAHKDTSVASLTK